MIFALGDAVGCEVLQAIRIDVKEAAKIANFMGAPQERICVFRVLPFYQISTPSY
jgi:hypothetical protein